MDKTLNVSIIYGVTTCLSLLLAGGYSTIVRKKENWLTWLYFSVFVANLGYFTLSISKTLEEVQKDVVTTPMDWPGAEMLSAREKDVLIRMLEDKKRKEIADELCITENTVKKHVSSIFAKLEVTNRNELFAKVARK